MRRRMRRTEGFTLIEVMVALVVFVIGFLGMAGLLVVVVQSNRGASNRTRADQLVYEKVEELMSTPYWSITSGSDEETVGGVAFSREWTVTNNSPVAQAMTIDLVARWTERGRSFRVQHATIKSAN